MMELIERLEKLEAPCRECDREIALAKGWTKIGQGWFCPPNMNVHHHSSELPRYTASIDAAMTLVPEGCDKWAVSGRNAATVNERHAVVQWSYAATPAIALCIAALKARQS